YRHFDVCRRATVDLRPAFTLNAAGARRASAVGRAGREVKADSMSKIYPVILSGGSGTRLWPLSRAMYPKQFIRFFAGSEPSFLGATLTRLAPSAGFAPPILLCNNDHRFLVKDEIERAAIEAGAIYLEPVARNTAAAIAVGA